MKSIKDETTSKYSQYSWNLQIAEANKYQCRHDWLWNKKSTPTTDYDLWVIVDGRGKIARGDKTYQIASGDCFLLRPDEDYYARQTPNNHLSVIYIHFDFYDEFGHLIKVNNHDLPPFYRRMKAFPFFIKILNRVIYYYRNKNIILANEWLKIAFAELNYQDNQINENNNRINNSENYIKDLCIKINSSPEKNYYLPELADDAGYSKDHFSRIFKKITGESFIDYVINSRIESAKILLLSSSYSIKKIATILGYKDLFFFSKQFKQKTAQSPTLYRG